MPSKLQHNISQPIKQWAQRRHKHYQLVTDDYEARLRESTSNDTEQELKILNSRSVSVRIEGPQVDKKSDENSKSGKGGKADEAKKVADKKQDDKKGNKKLLHGITLDSCHLPDKRLKELVHLEQLATGQRVASGYVRELNADGVQIKFDKRLEIEASKDSSKEQYEVIFNVVERNDIAKRQRYIENAARKFKRITCSLPMHKCVLGESQNWSNTKYGRARAMQLPGLAAPKGLQVLAVEESMKKRISLIEGVSGSGKTLVAANIAYSMSRLRKRKVIICSPIQATVDRLAKILNQAEQVNVVQLSRGGVADEYKSSRDSSETSENDDAHLLDVIIDKLVYQRGLKRFKKNMKNTQFAQQDWLHKQANRLVQIKSHWLRKKFARKVLRQADIVCCTPIQAGSLSGFGLHFSMLIIDDAHVAREADCLVPMMLNGIKQVTLLSDMHLKVQVTPAPSHQNKPAKLTSDDKIETSKLDDSDKMKNPLKKVSSRNILRKANGRNQPLSVGNKRGVDNDGVADQAQYFGGLFERWPNHTAELDLFSVTLDHDDRTISRLATYTNHHLYLSSLETTDNDEI